MAETLKKPGEGSSYEKYQTKKNVQFKKEREIFTKDFEAKMAGISSTSTSTSTSTSSKFARMVRKYDLSSYVFFAINCFLLATILFVSVQYYLVGDYNWILLITYYFVGGLFIAFCLNAITSLIYYNQFRPFTITMASFLPWLIVLPLLFLIRGTMSNTVGLFFASLFTDANTLIKRLFVFDQPDSIYKPDTLLEQLSPSNFYDLMESVIHPQNELGFHIITPDEIKMQGLRPIDIGKKSQELYRCVLYKDMIGQGSTGFIGGVIALISGAYYFMYQPQNEAIHSDDEEDEDEENRLLSLQAETDEKEKKEKEKEKEKSDMTFYEKIKKSVEKQLFSGKKGGEEEGGSGKGSVEKEKEKENQMVDEVEDKTDNVILLENKLTAAKLKRDKEMLKQEGNKKKNKTVQNNKINAVNNDVLMLQYQLDDARTELNEMINAVKLYKQNVLEAA